VPLTGPLFPNSRRYSARAVRGRFTLKALRVHELNSIWPRPVGHPKRKRDPA
jgi:hypothetical protein